MPHRPRRTRPFAQGRVALLGTVPVLLGAVPAVAGADVLVETLRPEGKSATDRVTVSRTLVVPGRPAVPLASQAASTDDLAVPGVVAPDRRSFALPSGSGIEILPTDGSPSRVLRRPGNDAAVDGLSTLWWSTDSQRVSISQSHRLGGRSSVLRCTVATGGCRSYGIGDRSILGVLAGERLVTASPMPREAVRVLSIKPKTWHNTTARAVARDRRALSRVGSQTIDVVEPDGDTRTLWRSRRSLATGQWSYAVASRPQSGEILVAGARFRAMIRTRTVRGRLQSRIDQTESGARLWHIDAEGRRLTAHPSPARDRSFLRLLAGFVHVPGVGWLERFATGTLLDPSGPSRPNGDLRSLSVGGRPPTIRGLEAQLLGRPPVLGSSAADGIEVAGFESATGSAVVQYQGDRDRWVVARVPLDGTTSPTEVYRGVGYEDLWSVHAW